MDVKKKNVAVFISGNGSNLKNLIICSFKKKSKFKVNLVISNNSKAKGLLIAKEFKIKQKFIKYSETKSFEKKVFLELKKNKINFICLAGFMKILTSSFIKKFNHKIINIHPSLLPRYKGLNTHERSIKNKDKFSGCTVHYVTSKLDSGKIIMQKKVRISSKDNSKSLAKKILKKEHELYPASILKIFN